MQKEEKKQKIRAKIPENIREQLIAAVDAEIKGDFVKRHKLNELSPSFPYNNRTMANRDSLQTGPKDSFTIGKYKFYRKIKLLEMLRADMS